MTTDTLARIAVAAFVLDCGGTVAVPTVDASDDSTTEADAEVELGDALLTLDTGRPPHDAAACLARPEGSCTCGSQPCGMLKDSIATCFTPYPDWCGAWSITFDEDGCALSISSPSADFTACLTKALAAARWPCEANKTPIFIVSCGPN
jgi:hypothetical protein